MKRSTLCATMTKSHMYIQISALKVAMIGKYAGGAQFRDIIVLLYEFLIQSSRM